MHRAFIDGDSLFLQHAEELTSDPVGNNFGIAAVRGRCLLEVGTRGPAGRQHTGIVCREAELLHVTSPALGRQLRQRLADAPHPGRRQHQRRQIRLRKVAVVLGVLLRALRHGYAPRVVPAEGLLHDSATRLQNINLSPNLVFQRLGNHADTVQVLDLRARAQHLTAPGSHRDIGLDSEGAGLHVTRRNPDPSQNLPNPRRVLAGLLRGVNIRLAHNLDQRHTGAVEINQAIAIYMRQLGRVFLKVHPPHADSARCPMHLDLQPAIS